MSKQNIIAILNIILKNMSDCRYMKIKNLNNGADNIKIIEKVISDIENNIIIPDYYSEFLINIFNLFYYTTHTIKFVSGENDYVIYKYGIAQADGGRDKIWKDFSQLKNKELLNNIYKLNTI